MLRLLAASFPGITVRTDASFEADLGAIMCARHLALSHSSLQTLFATNARLRSIYSHAEPGDDFWAGSCDAKVYVADAVEREREWTASAQQQLTMLTAHHAAANLSWRKVRPRCLAPLGRAGAGET